MSTHKKIDMICIAAVLFSVALTVLLISGRALGIVPTASAASDSDFFTSDDLKADWVSSSATQITLSDKGSTVVGNGAYVYNGTITIIYGGYYVLSGELTDGTLVIDAEKTDKVWILLNGVSLHCDDGAAIRVEQADKVFLTLAEGTENTVSSGTEYSQEITASGVDGTIYSRDDLTINGTGSLVVNAGYQHGIVCNDDLAVTGGDITITAAQDGIHANDSVRIRDAFISISAGDDGITVSNDDATAFLYVASGSITIPACYEGLEAVDITIAGGDIDIRPTDDGINANGNGQTSAIRITGGNITIINPSGRDADGLDSNGSIYIEGGRIFISVTAAGGNCALDCGSENGGECVISGGTVIACGGSTMAEGFDKDSPQGFLMYNTTAAAGAAINLNDSRGQELLSAEIPCSFSSVVISTPELNIGDVCTIEIDGIPEQITIDNTSSSGLHQGGMFGGGKFGGGWPSGAWENGYSDDTRQDIQQNTPRDMPQSMPENIPQDMPQGIPQKNGRNYGDRQGMDSSGDSGNTGRQNWAGGRDIQEAGGKAFTPDAENSPQNGLQFRQQGWEKTSPDGTQSPSAVSFSALAMVSISVLTLLIGLLIAVKIKH